MATCPSCGLPVADPGTSVCLSCGRRLAAASAVAAPAPGADMASVPDGPGAGAPGNESPHEVTPSAAPATSPDQPTQPTQGATIARAVGVTAVAALLSLFVFRGTAFQQLFLTLVFQNSEFSADFYLSIQGAAFFAFLLPIAYWVALVRLRTVERGRALVEAIAISLLFGFVVYQLCDMIQLAVISWGMPA